MEQTGTGASNPNDGGSHMGHAVDQASMGAHDAIDKASDVVRPAVDRIASGAHQAVDTIASVAGQAADTLGVKGDQLMNLQARAMEQARGYVRENPVASLGIAIAAGFLLSRLIRSL